MTGDIPLNHVARSLPPWRPDAAAVTECGLPAASYPTIGRDELAAQAKKLGRQRLSLLTCMTCLSTAERWWSASWERDPVAAFARELEGARWRRDGEARPIDDEVRAILELVARHGDEFQALVVGLRSTDRLDQARARKNMRRR